MRRRGPLAQLARGTAAPTLDEWWEPVRYQHRIGEIDVPALHISGWYDDEEIGTAPISPRWPRPGGRASGC